MRRRIEDVLQELDETLERTGGPFLPIRRAREAEDPDSFAEAVNALEIWGGTGSVLDFTPPESADDRRIMEGLVELEDMLGELGVASPRASQAARIVEDWLIAHPEHGRGTA